MGRLYGRVCSVTVNTLKLGGHRVAFDVEKTLQSEPNTAAVQIWNLTKEHRAELEELQPKKSEARGIPVLIEAGYQESGAGQIFLGDLRTVYSVRDGADWITTIESGDGEKAYQTSRVGVAFGAKTDIDTALRAIVRALGIGEGNLAKVVNNLKLAGAGKLVTQGAVIAGPVTHHLNNITRSAGLEWSIQDGAIQFLDRGKALEGFATILSPETGLIGSPTVDNKGILSAQMLMLPDIRPGSLLVVDSSRVKGNYRIEKAHWHADTFGADWYITVEARRY